MFAPGMFGAGLRTVTSYLGITPAQLRTGLAAGKSLAQISEDHGKTADGLVAALVSAAKSRLDRAVATKRLDSAREQAILARLRTFLAHFVQHPFPAPAPAPALKLPHGHGFGFGRRHAHWVQPFSSDQDGAGR